MSLKATLLSDRHRDSVAAETSDPAIEAAGDCSATARAKSALCQGVTVNLIPVPHNQALVAVRTEGSVPVRVVNIAKVNVIETGLSCDLTRAPQGVGRRRGRVEHPVGRMERREMQRNVSPQLP